MTSLRLSLVGLAALLLTSCMVGPDYTRPSVPMTLAYKEAPPPGRVGSWRSPAMRWLAASGGRSSVTRSSTRWQSR